MGEAAFGAGSQRFGQFRYVAMRMGQFDIFEADLRGFNALQRQLDTAGKQPSFLA